MTSGSIGFACSCAVASVLVMACGAEPAAEPLRSPPAAAATAAPAVVAAPSPPPQPEPSSPPSAASDPAPAAAAPEQGTAPFRRRKMDAFTIGRGGSRIGLPDDARAAFDSAPISRWGDALLEAMEGCYQPERERNPSLLGSAWSTLTLRKQGKSELQMNVVPPPLARVIACVRKRVPAPPAMPNAVGPTSFALRLSFQGPGRSNPHLR